MPVAQVNKSGSTYSVRKIVTKSTGWANHFTANLAESLPVEEF